MSILRLLLLGFTFSCMVKPITTFAESFDLNTVELYAEVIDTKVNGLSLEIKLINKGLDTLDFVDSRMKQPIGYMVWDQYGNSINPNRLEKREKKENYTPTSLKINSNQSITFKRFFNYQDNELVVIDKEKKYHFEVKYPLVIIVNGRRRAYILTSNSIELFTGGKKEVEVHEQKKEL